MGENARAFKRLYVKQADLDAFGYTPDCVRCKHAMKYGPGRINMPHSDQCRVRITEALRGTDAGRRRLEEFERRTNQQIAIEIQRDESKVRMDAPVAKGEIVGDGQAAASSAPAPLHFLIYAVTLSPGLSPQQEIITDPEGVEAVRNQSS